jgi:hypothetical protein
MRRVTNLDLSLIQNLNNEHFLKRNNLSAKLMRAKLSETKIYDSKN